MPSDALGHEVAKLLIAPSPTRDRLTAGMFIPDEVDDPVRQIDLALEVTLAAEPIEAKVRAATRAGKLARRDEPGANPEVLDRQAVDAGVITADEARVLAEHREWVAIVIRVDDFGSDLGTSLLRTPLSATMADAAATPVAEHRTPA